MNKGSKKLAAAGGSQSAKALKLGCSQQTVSRAVRGKRPGLAVILKAAKLYGIKPSDWLIEQ